MNYKKIREDLKNPKKKAIIQLIFYVIFFTIVFILFAISKTPETEDYKSYIKEKEDTSLLEKYSYKYEITDGDAIINVVGDNTDDTFIYNGEEYYNLNNKTYKSFNEEAEFYFDPSIYNYKRIESLIKKATFEEKVTHKDLVETVSYKTTAQDYFDSCDNLCDSDISIIIEKKDYINKVLIDLSNYYGYTYTVNIEYNDMN